MKLKILLATIIQGLILSCRPSSHEEMIRILQRIQKQNNEPRNSYASEARLRLADSLISIPQATDVQKKYAGYVKGSALLEIGLEQDAIRLFESLGDPGKDGGINAMWQELSIAYLRQGERANCISNHAAESCIMPIRGVGLHRDAKGSRAAIGIYKKILETNPDDLESRWLLNLAYMTLGEYPDAVPKELLIENMDGKSDYNVNPFQDIAADLGVDSKGMAGGSIVDDFNNDGFLDIVTSSWDLSENIHFFENTGDGKFRECTESANLEGITGGLNIMQTDYNNDGYKDIFVARGAWKKEFGREPNSLLRNNGDGTFTDVTTVSGLLSFHPTQAVTWNDFNNDGWLDLFIGNESSSESHPSELYINNQDGTFTETAAAANCNVTSFIKAVTSGDFDHDGWKDICISTMRGMRILLRNNGGKGKDISFQDVTKHAGLDDVHNKTFPGWFWDYNNDGWLDLFFCDYTFEKSLAYYAAAEKLNIPAGSPDKTLLYKNNHDGTFTNVAKEVGLNKVVFAMGSNFGDIDNDGYLDMYLGTGNPLYQSLVPNKMFKNIEGKQFVDVTTSARVGHLQKGHGVSFADLDNDGDQDIYIDMGGAYQGDAYHNSLFLNPGQGNNNWICLDLEGTKSNKAAIGTSIKLTFKENGITRSVYRDVNSGGSFGASPLRREIGVGRATVIDEIEIHWHGGGLTQVFHNVKPNQFLKITEGSDELKKISLRKISWTLPNKLCDEKPSL